MQIRNMLVEKLLYASKARSKRELAEKLGYSTERGMYAAINSNSTSLTGRVVEFAAKEEYDIAWLFSHYGKKREVDTQKAVS